MASLISHRPVRRAAIAGAVALGALVVPAAPALAQPVTIPGVGTFDVPDAPGVPALPNVPAPVAPAAPFVAPTTSAAQQAASAAQSKIGAPYVYGAAGPNAFDCSGLVQWAFQQAGVSVPRTSEAQAGTGRPVAQGDLQVGDIISFYGGGHSGIYVGNGNVVHASTEGSPVSIASVASMPYNGARRI